jgi:TIR domain
MRVFISHSSKDKPAVEALALALHERGIEPWLDKWEIGPGDDIVVSINDGLDRADAGIIVFSHHSRDSRWIEAEVSYLTFARIEERKVLIPVVLGDDFYVPPLLRPLARRSIGEVDAIIEALLHRKAGPRRRVRLNREGWRACLSACAGRVTLASGPRYASAGRCTGRPLSQHCRGCSSMLRRRF